MSQYEEQRNRLIPHAERYANQKVGKKPWTDREKWTIAWNLAFHSEMDRLAKFTRITEAP